MADAALAVLVADLFLAIQGLSGYAPPTVKPEVHRVSHATIEREICRGPCQIRAYYDPTRGVYIDETLDVQKDAFARSILLHELVHHVQSVSGRFDMTHVDCTRQNRAEAEAYFIKNRYLMSINAPHRVAMTGWASRCNESEPPTPGSR
jgi:hypothetical protein